MVNMWPEVQAAAVGGDFAVENLDLNPRYKPDKDSPAPPPGATIENHLHSALEERVAGGKGWLPAPPASCTWVALTSVEWRKPRAVFPSFSP